MLLKFDSLTTSSNSPTINVYSNCQNRNPLIADKSLQTNIQSSLPTLTEQTEPNSSSHTECDAFELEETVLTCTICHVSLDSQIDLENHLQSIHGDGLSLVPISYHNSKAL